MPLRVRALATLLVLAVAALAAPACTSEVTDAIGAARDLAAGHLKCNGTAGAGPGADGYA